ncbi:Protein of unknown function [Pyronema omphalodes CBS 100304]|uniref:CCHC-type domain-containing protein n=1 Tax=Pyronema omphalodes (strain CBS 100304) TaxID=1076935 RepID=U4L2G4_PYROM|nr:Protein of unknown function [Pyronema omphalodes CBS 100304]
MSQKPAPGAQPKNMSNRLLTMKFMQRAVHSNPGTSKAEASKIAAAAAEETARRTAALHQRPRPAAGSAAIDNDEETEWVLSYVRPVVPEQKYVDNVGYSEMFASDGEDCDSDSDQEEEAGGNATKKEGGRMVFGNFSKKNLEDDKKKSNKGDGEFDSDEELSSDEEEGEERERKPVIKQVSLRGLTSISNSGNAAGLAQMKCHKCNEKGHKASSCTKDVECYNCGKRGHMAGDCEEKRRGKRKEVEDRRDSMPKRGRPSM